MARHAQMKSSSPKYPSRKPPVLHSVHTRCVQRVTEIAVHVPYCYRYRLVDPILQASIKRSGILMPILVTVGDRPTVIAGHKRLHAARALKLKTVPVAVVMKMAPREAFLLNLVSNWKQGYSEIDRARAIGMAIDEIGFSEADTIRLILPLLGLPEDKVSLGIYQKIWQCPAALKDLVEDGRLPLRGITFLLKLSKRDQVCFAKKICEKAALTSSQLLQIGEWLADLMKGAGKDLDALLAEHKILDGLNVRGMDSRTKADRLFAAVKRLRFPGYSRYLEAFEEERDGILRDAKEFRLEPVQGFEEPGLSFAPG